MYLIKILSNGPDNVSSIFITEISDRYLSLTPAASNKILYQFQHPRLLVSLVTLHPLTDDRLCERELGVWSDTPTQRT